MPMPWPLRASQTIEGKEEEKEEEEKEEENEEEEKEEETPTQLCYYASAGLGERSEKI